MKFVNVREFKTHATRYLHSEEELVITRYGKPVARLTPITEETLGDLVDQMGDIFREEGITEERAQRALRSARRKVYGAPAPRSRR